MIIIILIIVILGVVIYYRNRGAIYFTNEDLMYAHRSSNEVNEDYKSRDSVYNVSHAIQYFADATASPPESQRSSSLDSGSKVPGAATLKRSTNQSSAKSRLSYKDYGETSKLVHSTSNHKTANVKPIYSAFGRKQSSSIHSNSSASGGGDGSVGSKFGLIQITGTVLI